MPILDYLNDIVTLLRVTAGVTIFIYCSYLVCLGYVFNVK